MRKIEIFGVVILVITLIIIGWVGNDLYKDITNNRILDGLWLKNYNQSGAKEQAYGMDELGDWICVNIKGMSYQRGLEVCQHEMGHEIFAEICEKNMTKCYGVQD